MFFISQQIWISRHIWQPMSDKLASTEQMFSTPYYCGLLIDQSLVFNRRRDGSQSAKVVSCAYSYKRIDSMTLVTNLGLKDTYASYS